MSGELRATNGGRGKAEAARLPRLMLVADGFASGRPELDAETIRQRVGALVEAGVPWVSLRDHDAPDGAFRQHAEALADDLRQSNPDVLLSVHGRLDVARALGAGFHAGRRGETVEEAVRAGLSGPVGASTHSATTTVRAAKAGADYTTLSPVFATRTHPEAAPAGIDVLRLASGRAGVPVLALGGITPPRARIARIVGAHGVAVLSALLFAWDIPPTVRQFLDAVD